LNIAPTLTRAIAATFTALMLAASAAPALADSSPNWTATVSVADDGTHTLGNPEAKVQVTEFVSYTCPHCANFQKQAEAPLRLAYVMPGKVSVRVVHFVRDSVDLSIGLLVQCGDPKGFFARHNMFLHEQDKWLTKAGKLTKAQRDRWGSGDFAWGMRAIASDLGFYDLMAHRGFERPAVDRCLADTVLANKLLAQFADAKRLGVPGTPSFAIGGQLVDAAYDWPTLDAAIKGSL
jgi:protein-disulfide isomerase